MAHVIEYLPSKHEALSSNVILITDDKQNVIYHINLKEQYLTIKRNIVLMHATV
jgi:hypothetical protein